MFAPDLAGGVAGFDAGVQATLAAQEEGHFWFEARNRLILDVLRSRFEAVRDFMELGCGTGFVLQAIARAHPSWRLTASEATIEGLQSAMMRVPGARFVQADARGLPFVDEFDLVGMFDVLEHIEEQDQVLDQIGQALRPGGGFVLTVPQHRWLWSTQDVLSGHVRRYDPGELEGALRRAGFEVVDSMSLMASLVAPMWWSRRRAAARMRLSEDELAPPRAVNRLFAAALALERGAQRAGLRLPVGGSRLVVARKPGAAG